VRAVEKATGTAALALGSGNALTKAKPHFERRSFGNMGARKSNEVSEARTSGSLARIRESESVAPLNDLRHTPLKGVFRGFRQNVVRWVSCDVGLHVLGCCCGAAAAADTSGHRCLFVRPFVVRLVA